MHPGNASRTLKEEAEQVPLLSALHSPFAPVCRQISRREFQKFQNLIYHEAGIWLSPAKTAMLTARLANRLRHLGMKSFEDYYNLVAGSPEERIEMLDAISTNETHFFREPKHFDLLRSSIFPEWIRAAAGGRRGRIIRVLSAGCSTGQEPYSLAMTLLDHFPPASGWAIEITATDLCTQALETAKTGIWPANGIKEIPHEYLRKFMLRGFGEQAGKIKAGQEIRSIIQFFRLNLNQSSYPFPAKFDLIFCRNVLIYFDMHSRQQAVHRLAAFLLPQGHFFCGLRRKLALHERYPDQSGPHCVHARSETG